MGCLNPMANYSVKGDVRRALQKVGFTVEKRPGPPGGKREMLVATKM
jgi:tRNA U34 5-methylaminomethyl-2-thiouridine-forming methyltransferase MnmC